MLSEAKEHHRKLNFKDAESIYINILKLDPKNQEVLYFISLLYRQTGYDNLAIDFLEKASSYEPYNPSNYNGLGQIYLKLGNLDKALENYTKLLDLRPDSFESYFNIAEILKAKGNFIGAIENYEKSIRIKPDNINSYNNLGMLYLEHLQLKKAESVFKDLLLIKPELFRVKKLLSDIQLKIKLEENLINNSQIQNTFSDINSKFDDNDLIYSYLKLIKKCLTDTLRLEEDSYEYKMLLEGLTWPLYAETMIGIKRLNNLHYCISDVLKNNIEGDFIETGVWKGGATIFMRAALKAYNIHNRNVWVADSFEGLPKPNEKLYPLDFGSSFHHYTALKISIEDVKSNFRKYDLLDDKVKFLKGWFKDTLPTAPIDKISVLRLDGDMYESTIDAITNLYPKLSVNGYIIIDDYHIVEGCKQAISDYRNKFNITEEIISIDFAGAFWKKVN